MRGNGAGVHASRYRCAGTDLENVGRVPCCVSLTKTTLDADALRRVGELLDMVTAAATPDLVHGIRRAYLDLQQSAEDDDTSRRVAALERTAERARKRLTNAARLFVDGHLTKRDYDAIRRESEQELDAAEQELERLRGRAPKQTLPPLETVLRDAGGWSAMLRAGSTTQQREVIGAVVDVVRPRRAGFGKYEAEIEWNATGQLLIGLVEATRAHVAA